MPQLICSMAVAAAAVDVAVADVVDVEIMKTIAAVDAASIKKQSQIKIDSAFYLASLWNYLNPVSIRIFYKINAHILVFKANTAHFLMMVIGSVKVIYYKG